MPSNRELSLFRQSCARRRLPLRSNRKVIDVEDEMRDFNDHARPPPAQEGVLVSSVFS